MTIKTSYADLDTETRLRMYVDIGLPIVRRALAAKRAEAERQANEKPAPSKAGGGSLDPMACQSDSPGVKEEEHKDRSEPPCASSGTSRDRS